MLYQHGNSRAPFQEQKASRTLSQVWSCQWSTWDWRADSVIRKFCKHLECSIVRNKSQNRMDESHRWHGVTNKAGERIPWSEKLLSVAPIAIREIKSWPEWIQGESRRITGKAFKELEGREQFCQYYYSSCKTTLPSTVKQNDYESRWNKSKRQKLSYIFTEKNCCRFAIKEV